MRVNSAGLPDSAGRIKAPVPPAGLEYPRWTGAQWISDQAAHDRAETESLRQQKQAELYSVFRSMYWSSVDFTLPDNSVVQMQFRNESDRQNIETVQQAASALVINGGGNVTFRMADNARYTMSAQHFMAQTLSIFADKQELLNRYWDARDSLKVASDVDGFDPVAEMEPGA